MRRGRTRARARAQRNRDLPVAGYRAQNEAERSQVAERDDRTAIRINGMTEPTAGANRPNEHRRAEEAILAAIEKGVPLSLACGRAGIFLRVFPSME